MGKTQPAIIRFVNYATKGRRISRKKLLLSIVSLFVATVILATSTVCWYMLMRVDADANITLDAGKGLRVNDLGDNLKVIADKAFLIPASSVDGRNLYFPADGNDFSKTTANMTFRSANAGDMNVNYVQINFELTAEADNTSVYLDDNTSVKIKDSAGNDDLLAAEQAIRTAIYYEGIPNNKPIVFCNLPKSRQVQAVNEVDRITGKFRDEKTQTAVPYKDYFYRKKQIVSMNQGETRRFSILIWLEGTDSKCTSELLRLKQLVINVVFKTSWDELALIEFEDAIDGHPIEAAFGANLGYKLVLNYNDEERKVVNNRITMYKDSDFQNTHKWKCYIPDIASKDLTFEIYDSSNSNTLIAKWEKNISGVPTTDRMTATLYKAESYNGTDSRGHWYDGVIEEGGIGIDTGDLGDDW